MYDLRSHIVERTGEDFYLAGTTMHCTPGVVILHSKDLVNWEFLSYCFDRFNMGDEFRLENGKEAYGQGIWAPCIRYHDGKFYVFSNINGHGMQVFIAENPAGPWEHINMGGNIYDLSVLFDDDGKIYAVYKSANGLSFLLETPWAKGTIFIKSMGSTTSSVPTMRRWDGCSVPVPTVRKGRMRR